MDFDGYHLKWPFGSVLLAAIRLDENNGLFSIANFVVESKCKESWIFFSENLSRVLGGNVFKPSPAWTVGPFEPPLNPQNGSVETKKSEEPKNRFFVTTI
ncbi:UNVERIFIED_CONTAM: hypothetical protein Slati_3944100 [Sesamum latifolium]|uniref:Uncharacterized protein n=1 Tax=Sesamum latifolium TaxID=2727402 RepID=A0AAW2TNY3_9LAMI